MKRRRALEPARGRARQNPRVSTVVYVAGAVALVLVIGAFVARQFRHAG